MRVVKVRGGDAGVGDYFRSVRKICFLFCIAMYNAPGSFSRQLDWVAHTIPERSDGTCKFSLAFMIITFPLPSLDMKYPVSKMTLGLTYGLSGFSLSEAQMQIAAPQSSACFSNSSHKFCPTVGCSNFASLPVVPMTNDWTSFDRDSGASGLSLWTTNTLSPPNWLSKLISSSDNCGKPPYNGSWRTPFRLISAIIDAPLLVSWNLMPY